MMLVERNHIAGASVGVRAFALKAAATGKTPPPAPLWVIEQNVAPGATLVEKNF